MTPTSPAPTSTDHATTVMLVDDHPSFRAAARWLLETEGYVVVAEAATGESALAMVAAAAPDVILLDVGLPGIDGFQVAAAMRLRFPHARVVLTSSRDLADLGPERVPACGARGFVRKAELSGDKLAVAAT
jgi:DNA-binding NarL/FixJ family response regulator